MNDYITEEDLKHNLKTALDSIKATEVEKKKVKQLCKANRDGGKIKHSLHLSKVIAAIIGVIIILSLGGGVIWAMTGSALKEAFFSGSDNEFEEVYSVIGDEYLLGEYKLIYEGSAYEEAVEHGYLNFSVYDMDGNPIEANSIKVVSKELANSLIMRKTQAFSVLINEKEIGLFVYLNSESMFTVNNNNNIFFRFSRLNIDNNDHYNDSPFSFLVLDMDKAQDVYNRIDQLDEDTICPLSFDESKGIPLYGYDINSMQPEVEDILNEYNPCYVKSINTPAQIIEFDGIKLTIGRMDIIIEFNQFRTVNNFSLVRDTGERVLFTYNKGFWNVEGNENIQTGGGPGNLLGDRKEAFNMGFVLGADEKVTIEVNGKTYR
ncbi:MAG: hypothetical protein IJL55_02075 [Lachnospiraceae bacterium]|nr:hypothetical protein [Lachnospiraceae bacterium]